MNCYRATNCDMERFMHILRAVRGIRERGAIPASELGCRRSDRRALCRELRGVTRIWQPSLSRVPHGPGRRRSSTWCAETSMRSLRVT